MVRNLYAEGRDIEAMFMFPGKKMWLLDRYGFIDGAVSVVKDLGNGYVSIRRKGCVSTITVKKTNLRKVSFFERSVWRTC